MYKLHRYCLLSGLQDAALQRLKHSHAAVLGIGGVGSWAVESLARSGIGGSPGSSGAMRGFHPGVIPQWFLYSKGCKKQRFHSLWSTFYIIIYVVYLIWSNIKHPYEMLLS